MTAAELFESKGFIKSVTNTEIAFTKGNDFIKFSQVDYSYWTNLNNVDELKEAIHQQLVEMGRV